MRYAGFRGQLLECNKSGYGNGRACKILEELGFDITGEGVGSLKVESRNPHWTSEELILGIHYILTHPKNWHSETDAGVIELSKTLQGLSIHSFETRTDSFRNAVGVALTLNSFKHFDPNHKGKGAKPSQLAYAIWAKYKENETALNQAAESVILDHSSTLTRAAWEALRANGCSIDELLGAEWTKSFEGQPTEKVAEQVVRIKQDVFRRRLMKRWNNRCAITGLRLAPLLRASHIKPWCSSNDEERLDPENGLLLSAAYDAAFDIGLISFEDNGAIMHSSQLNGVDAIAAGIDINAKISNLSQKNIFFLAAHRKNIFKP